MALQMLIESIVEELEGPGNPKRVGVSDMPIKGFKCKQCGRCCLNLHDAFSQCATDDDIKMWEKEGRDDILEWVSSIHLGNDHHIHDIWINPATHEDVERCPWLRKLPNQDKYVCRIHEDKPEHCRKFPPVQKAWFRDWMPRI
jgi:Fe-S-cluster containining protein